MNQLHLPNGMLLILSSCTLSLFTWLSRLSVSQRSTTQGSVPLVYNIKRKCITLIDDGSGQNPMTKHDFGPAAQYLFCPCELDNDFLSRWVWFVCIGWCYNALKPHFFVFCSADGEASCCESSHSKSARSRNSCCVVQILAQHISLNINAHELWWTLLGPREEMRKVKKQFIHIMPKARMILPK
jgi:hypothetical protein